MQTKNVNVDQMSCHKEEEEKTRDNLKHPQTNGDSLQDPSRLSSTFDVESSVYLSVPFRSQEKLKVLPASSSSTSSSSSNISCIQSTQSHQTPLMSGPTTGAHLLRSHPYQPPPLPPRGEGKPCQTLPMLNDHHESHHHHPSHMTTTVSYSAYKPVPPPKPLPAYPVGASAFTSGTHQEIITEGNHQAIGSFPSEDKIPGGRSTIQLHGGPPPPLTHILVTDQGHFHTHSTKFPATTDNEKLLSSLRCSGRFNGIDNPALLQDTPMQYQSPSKIYEGRMASDASPLYARMTAFDTGEVQPGYNYIGNHNHPSPGNQTAQRKQSYPAVSGVHPVSSEALSRLNQGNFRDPMRHVTFQTHTVENEHNHQNGGYFTVGDITDTNGYYMSQQQQQHTNDNSAMRPSGYVTNYTQMQIENRMNGTLPHIMLTHSPHKSNLQAKPGEANATQNQEVTQSAAATRGMPVGFSNECSDRKDEKWGSLKRAGKKYSHLKHIFTNKFSKAEAKSSDQENGHLQSDTKVTNSQGTNTFEQNVKEDLAPQCDESTKESIHRGNQSNLNASFHKAVRYSSLRGANEALPERVLQCAGNSNKGEQSLSSPAIKRNQEYYNSGSTDRVPMMESVQIRGPHNVGFFPRKSGSCGQLAQEQKHKDDPTPVVWSIRSNENLNRALPSDHAYPEYEANAGGSHMPPVREGRTSGGSDSGRGTGGSGGEREVKTHDTSIETSGSSTKNHIHGQSSGNESEWIDITEYEIQRMTLNTNGRGNMSRRNHEGCKREEGPGTPPLPLLSPESSPKISSKASPRSKKHSHSFSSSNAHKPDLLETTEEMRAKHSNHSSSGHKANPPSSQSEGPNKDNLQRSTSLLPSSVQGWTQRVKSNNPESRMGGLNINNNVRTKHLLKQEPKIHSSIAHRKQPDMEDELASTDAALDLNSVLDCATEVTTDDELTSNGETDVYLIRKQLEGLEGMYSEVLKLLGGRKQHMRRRMHGSLSSLPSSIASGRVGRDRRPRVLDDRLKRTAKEPSKSTHKRFQRLESHVVTLARSVAHLSSEMRTQHMMFQEIESIRAEVEALRTSGVTSNQAQRNAAEMAEPWNFAKFGGIGFSNPGRVKKLTQFFGDEPPLVRIFLRKLGYEKYAGLFEQEKIGMLELPYLTEERLQKIGIPLGPRIRILQEAQGPIKREGNLSVYVV